MFLIEKLDSSQSGVGELSNLKTGGKWLDENLGWAEFFDCLI
jgi:hypothetical protein